MLDELIVHIGRHKSGTSSLQHFLASRQGELDQLGYLYPFSGRANRIAHHALADACDPKKSDDSAPTRIIQELQIELQPHHHAVLLSSEAFQNVTDLHRLSRVADALGARKIRIICYVREHLDYAISGYRQMVQNQPRFMTFGAYARRLKELTGFIERWQAFGDLTLKWYDRAELKDGDIIVDFCELLDFEPGKLSSEDRNPSIGGNLLIYKLALNRLGMAGPGYNTLRHLAAIHPRFRAAFYVSKKDANTLRQESAYNEYLFTLLGPIQLRSWCGGEVLPDFDTLEIDLDRIDPNLNSQDRTRIINEVETSCDWLKL